MDVCKSELAFRKHPTTAVEATPRPPLVPAEKNNVVTSTTTTTRHRTREVPSRYKSPSPASGPRRCPSPTLTRTTSTAAATATAATGQHTSAPKRSQSADRRRPSTPPSPISPSTPAAEARRSAGGRVPESLWPSTMRSLSVSFQSDSISIPVIKKEKPPPAAAASSASGGALSERTLRPSSNVAPRKPTTPERKRSPLKGKNVPDQSENSRPLDGPHTARLIDQHRWPSRAGSRTISSNSLTRSVDLGPRSLSGAAAATTTPKIKPLQKSSSESSSRLLSSLEESAVTSRSLSRPASPSRPLSMTSSSSMMMSSTVSRGLSPSRGRPSTPPASRGVSPSRTATNQTANPNSVLSFIADFKKTKKGSSYIEDAHQLRLMYNRNLQWRFANARSRRVLYVQKVTAERTLFNVWSETLSLWDSVIRKRINLQQMKLDLKLNSVLNDQMDYLDDWALVERDHIGSLSGAVEDLEASTLRLPVTGGARADIDSLKIAICSAVDVMQGMASSTCSMLPRVESMNSLVSELAIVAAREKAMLNECESLLASTEAMQAEEYSLRTHVIQIKEDLGNLSSQFWQSRHQH